MLTQWVGGAFVLFAGTYTGFAMAWRCTERPESLRQIAACVTSLKSYMHYAAAPLAEGLAYCTAGAGRKTAAFFSFAAARLGEDVGLMPREAMAEALARYREELALETADCETLLLFASHLGAMDREEQQKHLTMIEKRFEILEREAVGARDRSAKMYRYLGVCGALMVILLLI